MIRVLVVDDSVLIRQMISDVLTGDPDIQVCATAKTGEEAILKVMQYRPDVITMDINMPEVDGLTALQYIMGEAPTPVVVVSAEGAAHNKNAHLAIEYGAVAIIAKDDGDSGVSAGFAEQILKQVKIAAKTDVRRVREVLGRLNRAAPRRQPLSSEPQKIVAIGSSTGGPKALQEVLPYFPANANAAFLLVQHMPAVFTRSFASRLAMSCKIQIKEAEDGDVLAAGYAYVAPGDSHMEVFRESGTLVIRLNREPPVHHVRPSVTVLMQSLAKLDLTKRLIAVILTGMGSDGVEGMRDIKRKCGHTLAEDQSTCVVFGMPRAAIEAGAVDRVVPLPHMGLEIFKLIQNG